MDTPAVVKQRVLNHGDMMFNKEIRLKRKDDVRYGLTKKNPEETLTNIMTLLRKHGCEKVGTMYEGDELRIGFQLEGVPFLIDVPKVHIRNVYDPKIGIRIVFRYLETVLELVRKSRAIPLHNLLLSCAQVRDDDGRLKPFGEIWAKRLAEGKATPEKLLLE